VDRVRADCHENSDSTGLENRAHAPNPPLLFILVEVALSSSAWQSSQSPVASERADLAFPGDGGSVEPSPGELAAFVQSLAKCPGLPEATATAVEQAKKTFSADHVAIFLIIEAGQIDVAATTDLVADRMAELLLLSGSEQPGQSGCGPGLEATFRQTTVVVPDVRTSNRLPGYGDIAIEEGVLSVMSVPLSHAAQPLGAISMYFRLPQDFTRDDVDRAETFATHVSVVLGSMREEAQLRVAVLSKHLIGQAQGILMERYDLTSGQAFGVLRRYSQTANRKLREVAEQVVSTRGLPDSELPAPT
jgi:GAF domain-containing protein